MTKKIVFCLLFLYLCSCCGFPPDQQTATIAIVELEFRDYDNKPMSKMPCVVVKTFQGQLQDQHKLIKKEGGPEVRSNERYALFWVKETDDEGKIILSYGYPGSFPCKFQGVYVTPFGFNVLANASKYPKRDYSEFLKALSRYGRSCKLIKSDELFDINDYFDIDEETIILIRFPQDFSESDLVDTECKGAVESPFEQHVHFKKIIRLKKEK